MQTPMSDKSNQKLPKSSQANGNNDSRDRSQSPTASLEPCEHCGEQYCTDVVVDTAEVALQCKPTTVVISHSAPSTPAKPLRKKRKLDSLVSKAKEQADSDTSLEHSPVSDIATEPDDSITYPLAVQPVATPTRSQDARKLKLQIPTDGFIERDFASSPQQIDSGLAVQDVSPSLFGMDPRSPERRKLDELHEGVKIIYKNRTPTKKSSRLSFLRRT
ncbi:hypothetical protein BFW01_g1600 [Lasiodiplodia theobromae]|uniref:Uncharacterized protein n=2 Tax=Lasiodiplodia TaxID=66739 RepID=A0A5N5D042_9PEZI|nr:uncharacterized protein LTHEOB_2892 [Lasiodiplodia theobromae]KAB2571030.1 hypothetical protein DBV05_g10289 [Lasiodiplodia theobromae]KAF4534917.1 hypothetical protein LTHEOB_2892 [Lasiodiplodia theobromae]KAF9641617.1 hypothetical protein BFW01_g1600 [Lasiodiplodia theobromae]KAK0640397.1 hypothetical protein DIS24_g9385 [Lasiodiplodia hormozganensis]